MLILPSLSELNEVIKTSKAILQSPVAAAIRFSSSMQYLLNSVYRQSATTFDPLDVAAAIVKHVSTDNSSKSHIRYSKVKVTWGDLQPAARATGFVVPAGIQYTWQDNTGEGNAEANDTSLLIAYCKVRNRFYFNTIVADRNAGSDILILPDLRGQSVHTWLGFISADKKNVSNSVYTGWMQVL